jgi:8-oxo-dGTP pyrophosphatase MutT (NUDIX family)
VTVVERRAARVLLVDPAGRALLLHGGDPARPGVHWWFTPGGGLEVGETPAQGAARELLEEVGLEVDADALGEPVWRQLTEFSYGGRTYHQEQEFFVLRVPGWQADFAGMDEEEKATITAHRWWSADEIEASSEQIFPVELPGLLRRLP